MDTTAFAFHRKLKMHHFLTCDLELRRPLPSGDAANVFSLVCFLFLFFCLVNAANTTAYIQKILLPDTNAAVLFDCI